MHPIERLRFVARANGVDDRILAVEATAALTAFADQPAALVAACRRVLARQPGCGPLWWACSRLLTTDDLWATARQTIAMLEDDATESALSYALGESAAGHHSDGAPVEVLHARARSGTMALVREPLAEAPGEPGGVPPGAPRWLVAGVGTALCEPMWGALVRAADTDDAPPGTAAFVDLSVFTHVVGPFGPVEVAALVDSDCPVAPELFTLEG